MNKYLIVDMRTGMMDGMFFELEMAQDAAERLEQRYEGSFYRVFEMLDDGRKFRGVFPPDRTIHAFMDKFFYKDKGYLR